MLLIIFMVLMILFIIYNFFIDYLGFSNINLFSNKFQKPNKCTYFFNPIPKTFVEHEEAARQLGGHLVSIHSAEENEKIKQLSRGNKIFIGGFRLQKGPPNTIYEPHYWTWCDHSQWSYTNWNTDWTGYNQSGGEPFIEMIENGKWNDVYNKYNFNIKRAAIYKINCDATQGTSYDIAKHFCEARGGMLAKIDDNLMLVRQSNNFDQSFMNQQNNPSRHLGISNPPLSQTDSMLQQSQAFGALNNMAPNNNNNTMSFLNQFTQQQQQQQQPMLQNIPVTNQSPPLLQNQNHFYQQQQQSSNQYQQGPPLLQAPQYSPPQQQQQQNPFGQQQQQQNPFGQHGNPQTPFGQQQQQQNPFGQQQRQQQQFQAPQQQFQQQYKPPQQQSLSYKANEAYPQVQQNGFNMNQSGGFPQFNHEQNNSQRNIPNNQNNFQQNNRYNSGSFPVQNYQNTNININSNKPIITANSLDVNEQLMYSILNDKQLVTDNFFSTTENRHNYIRLGRNFMLEISRAKNVLLPSINENEYEIIGRSIGSIYSNQGMNNGAQSGGANSLIHTVNNILSSGGNNSNNRPMYGNQNYNQGGGYNQPMYNTGGLY